MFLTSASLIEQIVFTHDNPENLTPEKILKEILKV